MKTQTAIKCPLLVQRVVSKDALKNDFSNGGSPKILQPAEYIFIQSEALSIIDSRTGDKKIFCKELHGTECKRARDICCLL